MSTTTLTFVLDLGAGPVDADAVVLSDAAATYGVRRADTNAVVVAANTVMTHAATGTYSHTFTEPAPGLVYQYVVKATVGANTHWFERRYTKPLPAYMDVDEADALAATTSGLVSWSGSTAPAKAAALVRASDDIDHATTYQGRRYATTTNPPQTREFPRLAFEEPLVGTRNPALAATAIIWDYDDATAQAVVPADVKSATLLQADAILTGTRDSRLDLQHDGVVYDQDGSEAESYRRSTGLGLPTGICRRAWLLIRHYRIKAGRLL
jgi:hypothetical protein